MSRRRVGYLVALFLIAGITSLPQLFFVGLIAQITYLRGECPLPSVPGFGVTQLGHNRIANAEFWRGKFIHLWRARYQKNGPGEVEFATRDASDRSNGRTCFSNVRPQRKFRIFAGFWRPLVLLYATWFARVRRRRTSTVEFRLPRDREHGMQVLIDGEPSILTQGPLGFEVWQCRNAAWVHTDDVDLPNIDVDWAFGDKTVNSGSHNK